MKKNQLLTAICIFLFALPILAQSTIGIPVQGIARDANGTARIGQSVINLTFELYSLNGTQETPLGSPQTQTLSTDSFGVFSTIIDTNGLRPAFANSPVYLRISEGGTTISDEQLNSVPYAIAADNGVPTGAIMPFVGTANQVPEGWLLCDGSSIPSGVQFNALRTLYGTTTPDLKGMFLRGAEANDTFNTSIAPVLNTSHDDFFQNHTHSNTFGTNSDTHSHRLNIVQSFNTSSVGSSAAGQPQQLGGDNVTPSGWTEPISESDTHSHSITGSVGNPNSGQSGSETRPMHYVVNYIIKL